MRRDVDGVRRRRAGEQARLAVARAGLGGGQCDRAGGRRSRVVLGVDARCVQVRLAPVTAPLRARARSVILSVPCVCKELPCIALGVSPTSGSTAHVSLGHP